MKLTQDVRDFAEEQQRAEQGMQDKAREFRDKGGELYAARAEAEE